MTSFQLAQSIVSLLCFYAALKWFFTAGRIHIRYIVSLSFCIFAYLLYSSFYAVCYYFTGKGIDYSVIYHIRYGLTGAGYGEYKLLIVGTVLFLCLSSIFFSYVLYGSRKRRTPPSVFFCFLSFLFLFLSSLIHPATADLYMMSRTKSEEPFFKYYRKPLIRSSAEKGKNFLFIYAESLEKTYFDEDVFPGLVTYLRGFEAESISFSNIGPYPDVGWTIAGMVASQCGLPLMAPSHGNSMAGMDTFLAGADCMGDLLETQDYRLVYMGGASLDFAGKGKFYRTHGFAEVFGRDKLLPKLPDSTYRTNWGLHDDSLFALALQKFEKLSSSDQPFGLFLLTLDTHGSGTHLSKSCKDIVYGDGKNGTLNAIACSDYLIFDFIKKIRELPNFGDTVIVLASDHLAMRNSAFGLLKKSGKRNNLFVIYEPENKSGYITSKRGSTIDIGATVLGVLGFDSYLGLGRDLLNGEGSSLEKEESIYSRVQGWRKDIEKFWSFPDIAKSVTINAKKKNVKIDDRVFQVPVLLGFDDKLRTKMWFEISNASFHKTLLQHLETFSAEESFLIVNDCLRLPGEWVGETTQGLCFAYGTLSSAKIIAGIVNDSVSLTAKQLRDNFKEAKRKGMHDNRLRQINLARIKNKNKNKK